MVKVLNNYHVRWIIGFYNLEALIRALTGFLELYSLVCG